MKWKRKSEIIHDGFKIIHSYFNEQVKIFILLNLASKESTDSPLHNSCLPFCILEIIINYAITFSKNYFLSDMKGEFVVAVNSEERENQEMKFTWKDLDDFRENRPFPYKEPLYPAVRFKGSPVLVSKKIFTKTKAHAINDNREIELAYRYFCRNGTMDLNRVVPSSLATGGENTPILEEVSFLVYVLLEAYLFVNRAHSYEYESILYLVESGARMDVMNEVARTKLKEALRPCKYYLTRDCFRQYYLGSKSLERAYRKFIMMLYYQDIINAEEILAIVVNLRDEDMLKEILRSVDDVKEMDEESENLIFICGLISEKRVMSKKRKVEDQLSK